MHPVYHVTVMKMTSHPLYPVCLTQARQAQRYMRPMTNAGCLRWFLPGTCMSVDIAKAVFAQPPACCAAGMLMQALAS